MSVQTEIPRNKATIGRPSQEPVVDVPEASSNDLSVDVAELGAMVLGRWAEIRTQARTLCENPAIVENRGQPIAEHRQRVLDQLSLWWTPAAYSCHS